MTGHRDPRSGGDSVTLIERLAELANAATPGPWSASTDPGHAPSARVRAGRRWLAQTCPTLGVASDEDFANAAYIAAANPETILSLIDRLAVLELREGKNKISETDETSVAVEELRNLAARLHYFAARDDGSPWRRIEMNRDEAVAIRKLVASATRGSASLPDPGPAELRESDRQSSERRGSETTSVVSVEAGHCVNCGHSKQLHHPWCHDPYIPGKCNYQYDLCGCRDYREPEPASTTAALPPPESGSGLGSASALEVEADQP